MGFKSLFNSVLEGTHYRLVNKDDYERIFACKDAGVSAADSAGRSITDDLIKLFSKHRDLMIFDVGANKGGTCRLFRSLFPQGQIYCFEPDPRVYAKLLQLAGRDPLIRCEALAVSDKDGEVEFHLARASETNSILPPVAKENEPSRPSFVLEKIKVKSVTLDQFAAQAGIKHIDLLKMDIQGAEIRALEGASRLLSHFQIDCLYLELCFDSGYEGQPMASEIIDYLHKRSYDLSGLYNLQYDQASNLLGYCDGLFIPNKPKGLA